MSNAKVIRILDILSYVFVLATVVLIPLFFDSGLVNYFVLPKQYLFIGLVLLNILIFAVKVVLSRRFYYRQSVLDIPLLILLVIALVSSFFSSSLYNSFLGRNETFLISFIFLVFCTLFYFTITNIVTTINKWRLTIDVLLIVGAVSSMLFILKNIFNFSLPVIGNVYNTVSGSNTAFGFWLILMIVLSAGKLIKKNVQASQAIFYFFVMMISFIPLLVIGFKLLWWVLVISLLLLLLYGFSFIKNSRIGWLSIIFALSIIVVNFIVFGSPKSLMVKLPVEISLGTKPSWTITKQTVFSGPKNFVLGSGPGSFAADFSKFRTASFNYDQLAWSLRFSHPFNTYFAIFSEMGVVFSLGLVLVLLLVIGHTFRSGSNEKQQNELYVEEEIDNEDFNFKFFSSQAENQNHEIYLVFIAWIVLWIAMGFGYFGPVMWVVWWLLLGLLMSGLALYGKEVVTERYWQMEDIPQYNLAFSFSLIVVMAGVIMLYVLGMRFYVAENVYTKALVANDSATTDTYLQKALSLRSNYDLYHMAQAKSYLEQASAEARKSSGDNNKVASLVATAVNQARLATQLSPNTVATWENLAVMYENASLFVTQATDWAIKSLQTANTLEPSNSYLNWKLGNIYFSQADYTKAIESYKKAIELKSDYVAAYMGLAGAYERNKEIDKAISTYELLVSKNQRSADILYNYGRLLYNRNATTDRKNAENLWLYVVKAQPNHSNTLYSLALLYEGQGYKSQALSYYYKVKEINPNNQDVIKKINSLIGVSPSN